MNFVGDGYYKLNRRLLLSVGLWPYERSIYKYCQIILCNIIVIITTICEIAKLMSLKQNDVMLKVLSPIIICFIYIIKYQTFCIVARKIKYLMDHVEEDWNMLKDKKELEIIEKYTYIGSMCTLSLTILGFVGALIFLFVPLIPNILDIIAPLNISRQRQFIFPGEYFVDQQKFFYAILLQLDITIGIIITTLIGTESLYVTYVQHACAMFQIASYRMDQAFNDKFLQGYTSEKQPIIICKRIIEAIHIHKRALESLLRLITTKYDVDLVLRVLSSALPFMLFTVKYITFYFVTENIKELMTQIHNDWNALKDNNELKIIHRYAKAARLLTTSLAILIYVCILMVICIQYVPIFLDIIMPLNKSRQTELLFQVEYFLDQEKYYHTIQFHLDVGLIIAAMTILSTESFCLTLAIHAFGMFKITSYRMERIIDKSAPNTFVGKYYVFHNNIVTAVNGHRRAIEFSEIVKSTFAIPYLALILLGVTSSSVNLFLLFQVIMSSTTIDDLIRSIIFVFCHFIYMFSTNYAGQKFIDHDADIYKKICNIQWYDAPLRTQKQILFIIQKTIKSYHIDIGGFYSPSLEGFTMLASTSLSYFTVLCSIQK
ncbi:uncharacterized protein LOC143895477 [Temnothorax americanus]|uniref:uncharacterized protein LOC143895477 n=1 Tax=Temnothorax americanus TaxID=1964332 RepID=UPI0040690CBC